MAMPFSIGPGGLVDQWSLRAEQIFGIPAERAVGMDPIEAFIDPDLRDRGQRKMAEILDGREWTGVVPFRMPDSAEGERGEVCIFVLVSAGAVAVRLRLATQLPQGTAGSCSSGSVLSPASRP